MTVSAEISGKRIALTASYEECGPVRAKRIPGRRWDGDLTANTYPLSWQTCVALRKEFGGDLKVGPQLTAWAWDEHRKAEAMEGLRAGTGAKLPTIEADYPRLWSALSGRPFQIAGAAFLLEARRAILGWARPIKPWQPWSKVAHRLS